ncbi:MAG: beta-N-acetylhexosaminidase [Pseudomonadota bacterium]|nr:beta-N-acetylhexosaminidase [Pseudomonadota bacterium]
MSGPNILPIIFGCARTMLLPEERRLFREANPLGFILFARNCESPDQVRGLIAELRQAVGRPDAPILIDQEGGRVARLKPPHWPQHPPARAFGLMYEKNPEWGAEAVQLHARLIANELVSLGITVNCAPTIDLFMKGASQAIGDRAFSRKPQDVAALARLWAETFLQNGVLPVIKHFPGYGRVKDDPHHMLPVIEATRPELESDDFVPFELLKDLPIGMTAHAVFTALDPGMPASLSATIHQDIIRGALGFDGLLLSDDIVMKALQGPVADRARQVLEAGTDVILHCNGDIGEMRSIAPVLTPMTGESLARWVHAQSMVKAANPKYSPVEDTARLDTLLGGLAYDDGMAV